MCHLYILYISHREDLGKCLERSLNPLMPILALEIAASICAESIALNLE